MTVLAIEVVMTDCPDNTRPAPLKTLDFTCYPCLGVG